MGFGGQDKANHMDNPAPYLLTLLAVEAWAEGERKSYLFPSTVALRAILRRSIQMKKRKKNDHNAKRDMAFTVTVAESFRSKHSVVAYKVPGLCRVLACVVVVQ